MLVPNPSTDFRALIGDRDAEDTSDLSETDVDVDDSETLPSLKNILVDSRTIIGGKNVLLENINGVDYPDTEIGSPKFEEVSVHVHAEVIINGDQTDASSNDESLQKDQSEEVKDESSVDESTVNEARNDSVITETPCK